MYRNELFYLHKCILKFVHYDDLAVDDLAVDDLDMGLDLDLCRTGFGLGSIRPPPTRQALRTGLLVFR